MLHKAPRRPRPDATAFAETTLAGRARFGVARRVRALGLLVVAGFAMAPTAACDSTATIFPVTILFRELQVVSAFPAKQQADGSWARQCTGTDADGFLLNTAFVSTTRAVKTSSAEDIDNDNSIRPGDVVSFRVVARADDPEAIQLTNEENFSVTIDCMDPLPDGSGAPNNACSGAKGGINDAVLFNSFQRDKRSQTRDDALKNGHNIMLIVDQSGSTQGLVDKDTLREGDPQVVGANIPTNFGQIASDQANLRHTAVKSFIRTLNKEDRVGVLAFGEGLPGNHLTVPCASDQKLGNVDDDLELCFGRNHALWTDEGGISSLGGGKNGRANLWQAVERAYQFLVERADLVRTNHIIIVTDGPDTCTFSADFTECQSPCSTTDYDDVIAQVQANLTNPNGVPIHVHFVQFESKGYAGRDTRQIELACLTEGHYQYINTNDLSDSQTDARLQPMEQAMANVRHSLMGVWQFAINSAAFSSNSAPPLGTPMGSLYAVSGTIDVLGTAKITSNGQNKPVAFGVGLGDGATSAPAWDRRPTIRKPCGNAVDCGAPGDSSNSCQVICSQETLLCPAGAAGVSEPDTAPCSRADGGSGQCCGGTCEPTNQLCPACAAP
jgi:hypothetical protein